MLLEHVLVAELAERPRDLTVDEAAGASMSNTTERNRNGMPKCRARQVTVDPSLNAPPAGASTMVSS
ncbi:hypothetical protein [Microbacterium paraoxydans]|uniref:hypothetical protein n=1 Tax=Microbacterium paraoxydans TaxID=199592 RepID=UPI003D75E518